MCSVPPWIPSGNLVHRLSEDCCTIGMFTSCNTISFINHPLQSQTLSDLLWTTVRLLYKLNAFSGIERHSVHSIVLAKMHLMSIAWSESFRSFVILDLLMRRAVSTEQYLNLTLDRCLRASNHSWQVWEKKQNRLIWTENHPFSRFHRFNSSLTKLDMQLLAWDTFTGILNAMTDRHTFILSQHSCSSLSSTMQTVPSAMVVHIVTINPTWL